MKQSRIRAVREGILGAFIYVLILFLTGCATTRSFTPEQEAYMTRARQCPLTISVAKGSEAEIAWSRAHSFITQYSSMKIQTATEYTIQTYNPIRRGGFKIDYGYSLSKLLTEDDVQMTVRCFSNNEYADHLVDHNAHLLAHYMKTGELMPELINR